MRAIIKKSRAPSSGKQKSIPARAGQRASKPKKLARQNSDVDYTDLDSGSEPSTRKSRAPSGGKQKSIPARTGQRASKPKKLAQRNSDVDCTDLDSGSEPSTRKSAHDAIMPKGGNTVNLLPSIIASSKAIYFATLLNALYASEEPFDDFVKTSPQFLMVSRKAFRKIWPVLNVLMETDHLLFNLVSRFVLAVGYAHILCTGVSTRVGETR